MNTDTNPTNENQTENMHPVECSDLLASCFEDMPIVEINQLFSECPKCGQGLGYSCKPKGTLLYCPDCDEWLHNIVATLYISMLDKADDLLLNEVDVFSDDENVELYNEWNAVRLCIS